MAELYLNESDIRKIATQFRLPVKLGYRDGRLVLSGSFSHLWEQKFVAEIEFRKWNQGELTLEIVKSHPSLGVFDRSLKQMFLHFFATRIHEQIEINYPVITIQLTEFVPLSQMFSVVEISNIDFEQGGVRIGFYLIETTEITKA